MSLTTRPGATSKYVAVLHRDPCCYCGTTNPKKYTGTRRKAARHILANISSMTIDHIQPRQRGTTSRILDGTGFSVDHWSNLTAACFDCNQRRGHAPLLPFLMENPIHA